eukprot:1315970-Amorphochlora_amoeboformis.AAC.2
MPGYSPPCPPPPPFRKRQGSIQPMSMVRELGSVATSDFHKNGESYVQCRISNHLEITLVLIHSLKHTPAP